MIASNRPSDRSPRAAINDSQHTGEKSAVRRRGRPKTSAASRRAARPGKPYKSFPLTPHRNGQFCKKIRGKIYYFGPTSDPSAALERYHEHCDGLHSGKLDHVPRSDALTISELANKFLEAAEQRRDAGSLAARTFVDYFRDCERLVKFFGKDRAVESIGKDDFVAFKAYLQKDVKPSTLKGRIGVTRSIFKFAFDEELIPTTVRFGRDFRRPEQRVLRLSRAQAGRRHLLPVEIRQLLAAAPLQLKAMILLGVNCGFGNKDCAELQLSNIDLDHGWVYFPRVKTGVDRRCPLWPETIAAIRAVLGDSQLNATRRRPEAANCVFVTKKGHQFVRSIPASGEDGRPRLVEHDVIATAMKRLMQKQRINLKRVGFYGLRHTFETLGAETGNQVAVNFIMGHAPPSTDMGDVYRGGVAEAALRQVTDHVRALVLGISAKTATRGGVKRTSSSVPAGSASGSE
jgi:integrase